MRVEGNIEQSEDMFIEIHSFVFLLAVRLDMYFIDRFRYYSADLCYLSAGFAMDLGYKAAFRYLIRTKKMMGLVGHLKRWGNKDEGYPEENRYDKEGARGQDGFVWMIVSMFAKQS